MLSEVIKGNIGKKRIKKYASFRFGFVYVCMFKFVNTSKDTRYFLSFFLFDSMGHNHSSKIVLALYPSWLTSNHSLIEADPGCRQHLRWSSCDKS